MTSADSLSLILRRLDEIERKLDRMEELRAPTAIGYSVRRGNLPKKDLRPRDANLWSYRISPWTAKAAVAVSISSAASNTVFMISAMATKLCQWSGRRHRGTSS